MCSEELANLNRMYNEQIKAQNWGDALNVAERLINLDPQKALYYLYRGFVFYKMENLAKAKENFQQALVLSPTSPGMAQWWLDKMEQERRLLNSEATALHHYLIFYPYQTIVLERDKIVRIGRDWKNDLVLPSNDVSRFHALIEWDGNSYMVRDLNSTNCTKVNAAPIQSHRLLDGEIITIGNNNLYYRVAQKCRKEDLVPQRFMATCKIPAIEQNPSEKNEKTLYGDLSCVSISNVLQMLAADQSSGCLALKNQVETGSIFLQKGIVVHCSTSVIKGEEAFYELMHWQKGNFDFDSTAIPTEMSMENPVEYLLFETARRFDEKIRYG